MRRVLVVLVLALAAAALAVWWMRDLPRRKVESALEDRLGADVRLGRLAVLGARAFALHDLEIGPLRVGDVEATIAVGRLGVRGSVGEILEGRIEAIEATATTVDLRRADGPPPPAGEPAEVLIGSLDLGETLVRARDGDDATAIVVAARLAGVGGMMTGTIDARAGRLALGPILRLAGVSDPPAASLDRAHLHAALTDAGRRLAVEITAVEAAVSRDGRRYALDGVGLDASAIVEPDVILVRAVPSLALFDRAALSARVSRSTGEVGDAELVVRGADLGALSAWTGLLPRGASIAGRANLDVRGDGPNRFRYALESDLDAAGYSEDDAAVGAEGGHLEASGEIVLGPDGPSATVAGQASIDWIEGSFGGRIVPPGLVPVRARFEASLAGPDLSGRVTLETARTGTLSASGTVGTGGEEPRLDVRWALEKTSIASLRALDAAFADAFPIDDLAGTVAAKGTLAGTARAPVVTGTVEIREARGAGRAAEDRAWAVRDGRADLGFRWKGAGSRIAFDLDGAAATVGVDPFEPRPVEASAAGSIDPGSLVVSVDAATVAARELGTARFRGEIDADAGPALRGHLDVEGAGVPAWRKALAPAIGNPAPGFEVQGTAGASLDVALDEAGAWSAAGTAEIASSGFSSEDGARVLQGFDTTWNVAFGGALPDGRLEGSASAAVGGYLVLWNSFFADASDVTSTVEVGVELPDVAVRWTFPQGPAIEGTITVPADGPLSWQGRLAVDDLGSTLERYVRQPLDGSVPFLDRLRGAGALRAETRGTSGDRGVAIDGTLRLQGVHLGGTEGVIEIDGLDLDLPVSLRWGPDGSGPTGGEALSGALRFDRWSLAGLDVPPTETALRVDGDTVALEEGIALPVLGGAVVLEELTLASLARPGRRLETAVLLHDVRLEEASAAFGLPPLSGSLEGYFPRARIDGSTLEVDGGGSFDVFGGTLRLDDISGEEVLSRYPKVRFSATFEEIDLLSLTRTFDFGEMTGTLRGEVRDCELFRGVPTRFEGFFETVERPGVGQSINVKAINNIAILGTGGKVGVFDRGIHKFFDRYTYSKLGIRMRLDNDVFLMRGLAKRGDRELFLRGRLPFPIDVVNAQPGKTVSFRTMLQRLQSLDVSAATSSP